MNLGDVGKKGEDLTAKFLVNKGCMILKRNYACRYGEIDIIAQKGRFLLFVEVKTRKENSLVSPAEAVDSRKAQRIILTSRDYMRKTETEDLQPRFDIAEITVCENGDKKYKLNYIKNAF